MATTELQVATNGEIIFPDIREAMIGDAAVQSVSARDLHVALRVGKDFSNWIKDRVVRYGFTEGTDFVTYVDAGQVVENMSLANSGERVWGGQNRKEYALTLDTAKEIAMVERNEAGRTIRRYFIACERMLRDTARREVDLEALIDRRVTDKLDAALARQNLMLRYGRTAGQIYSAAGFPPMKGMAAWFGNRLREMECSINGEGRSEQGGRTARVFDPDKASLWLERNGGRLAVERKLALRRGQRAIHLIQPRTEAERTY